MLGLRRVPEMKASTPEEKERDRKIREVKKLHLERMPLRITPSATAFRGFARQFRIEGSLPSGPREFMRTVKTEVLKIMIEN